MRILFVIESLDAGSGRHVVDLARGLGARGHELTVAYATHRANDAMIAELEAAEGVVPVPFRMRRSVSPRDVLALIDLERVRRDHGPFDIVHGHSSKGGAAARLMAAGGAKRVYTPHAFRTLDPTIGKAPAVFYDAVERTLGRFRSDQIVVGSEPERERAKVIGIPDRKVCKISNAMTPPVAKLDRSALLGELGLSPEAVIVGFVGRLERQKHPELFVAAFARAADQNPDVNAHAVVIGDGALRAGVEADIARLGVGDRVHLLGAASGVRWMPAFDVFAATSRYESNVTYVWIEALFHGLPIVTTRVGDAPVAVLDGRSGYIVEVDAEDAMADRLGRLISDAGRRHAFGSAATEHAQQFHLDVMVDKHIDVYRRLLSS